MSDSDDSVDALLASTHELVVVASRLDRSGVEERTRGLVLRVRADALAVAAEVLRERTRVPQRERLAERLAAVLSEAAARIEPGSTAEVNPHQFQTTGSADV